MLSFIINLFIMSGIMSLVVIVLLAAKKPMKRFSAACRYILWTLVIIRLCIPFSGVPNIINLSFEGPQIGEPSQTQKNTVNITVPDPKYSGETLETVQYTDEIETDTIPEENTSVKSKEAHNIKTQEIAEKEAFIITSEHAGYMIFGLWCIACLIFFSISMLRYLKNTRILNADLRHTDNRVFDIYLEVCREYGIKRIPELYFCSAVKTPMVYGFLKTKVILPEIELSNNDIKGVLRHELVHYRRGDLYIKLLALVANSLHWFNPFAYISCKSLFNEMELSCDERVLKNSDKEVRISYGVAMLEIVKKCRRSAPSLTTGFNPKRKAVKDRFENILDTAKKKKGVPVIILMLCICIICTSIVGYGTGNEETGDSDVVSDTTVTDENFSYSALLSYDGEIEDIQPIYDIMDNSMEAFGVSLLTTSEGEFLLDYNGEIKTELPESEFGYKYCSVCYKITDHINSVDPFTLECAKLNSGHGGGNGYYIYNKETNIILKTDIGSYIPCRDIDFAVVSEAVANSDAQEELPEEADAEEFETEHFEYTDDGIVYTKEYLSEYLSRPSGYYTQTGKYAIVSDGALVTDFEFDGYLDFDTYGICALKKDGKWGYYNHKGEMIYDHLYEESAVTRGGDHTQNIPYSSSGGLIALKKNGKWGYGDTHGNIIADFIFDEARPVSCGKAWVKEKGSWRVIEFTNIENDPSYTEAVYLANDYLDNFYYSEPKPSWKFVGRGEKEYYLTPCYSLYSYVYGGEYGVDFTHEIIVTKDKSVYQTRPEGEYSVYPEGE